MNWTMVENVQVICFYFLVIFHNMCLFSGFYLHLIRHSSFVNGAVISEIISYDVKHIVRIVVLVLFP